jgi:hypothetical protein
VRTLEPGLAIATPVGKTVVYKRVVCECLISICERVLPANLVVLPIDECCLVLNQTPLFRFVKPLAMLLSNICIVLVSC